MSDYLDFLTNDDSNFIVAEISSDICEFLSGKTDFSVPGGTGIIFWKDRISHIESHKNDFMSDVAYQNSLESIPEIISSPDYLALSPDGKSLSFIKEYSQDTCVVVRVSKKDRLAIRTMYPLMSAQLDKYISDGHAWKYKQTDV